VHLSQSVTAYAIGNIVKVSYLPSLSTVYMIGTITDFTGTSLTVTMISSLGSGTYNNWIISNTGAIGPTGGTGPTGPTGPTGGT
jgi:hypothetical protein